TYSRVRASGLFDGWPYQPSTTWGPETPRPSRKRPLEMWSMVMAAMAVAVGVRAESCTTEVPSLMVDVWPAIQARGEKASEPQASAVHTESNPRRSASTVVSMISGGG